ncbi:MAG: lipopolysaccharide heptosyltransferase II [Acidobacteria bacterium]|nr:lipopolysaccharide heptosyltransferase II [Acidobacteriota bacterium]
MQPNIKKILVRGANWIGDAVMSVPAMRELRRIFPDAKITLHTRSWAEGVFRDASFIDEIVTYDKHKWVIKDILDNSQFLREDGYDLAVLFPNSFESALTSFLTRIPRRVGYNKDARGLLLTDPIAVPEWKHRRHESFYYLNLVSEVEKAVLGRETVMHSVLDSTIEISEERQFAAREQLTDCGVDLSKRTVALGVGSTNSRAKRWPAERYAELSDRLQAELDVNVLLVGSKDEVDVAKSVASLASNKPISIVGKTSIDEVAAIFSEIDLMISNDMGLAHLAPAVGALTIVLFGPTDPETTAPFSRNSMVMREPVECSPCMLRECPIDHRCMTRITVDRVFDQAFRTMDTNHRNDADALSEIQLLH